MAHRSTSHATLYVTVILPYIQLFRKPSRRYERQPGEHTQNRDYVGHGQDKSRAEYSQSTFMVVPEKRVTSKLLARLGFLQADDLPMVWWWPPPIPQVRIVGQVFTLQMHPWSMSQCCPSSLWSSPLCVQQRVTASVEAIRHIRS
eukprot:5796389-Amphidinium_carterae.1